MNTYVIDASVAAKWVLPAAEEPFADKALELLKGYVEGKSRIIVPDLFWAELGNIIWKALRVGRLAQAAAAAALSALTARNFPTVSSRTLLEDAFTLASAFDRTVYDALYVALAIRSKALLITADEHLADALAAHLPVRSLGSHYIT